MRVITVLAGGAIGLAACGSSGSASTGGGSSGTSASSNTPVTIGLLAPMTGTRADLGKGMQLGAQLAVDAINANGGVLGHHLNLVTQDTAADPADAVPAAQLEVNSDHVVAFVGPTSITAGVTIPIAQKAGIPDLMFGGGSEFDAFTNPYFFRMSPSDTEQAEAMMLYAHSKGWDKVAMAFGASSGSQSLIPGIQASAKALGMQIVANVTLTAGSTSFRSEINQIFANHPQVVVGQFNNTTAGILFGEISQEGLSSTPWIGTNLWYTNTFFNSVGASVASGPIYLANSSSAGMLGASYFLNLLKTKTGQTVPANGETFMYDAVTTWALGADQAGTWAYPKVRSGILAASNPPGTMCGSYAQCYSLIKAKKDINWEGSASTVDFNKYDNVFGPFAILHYDQSGNTTTVETLTATQIENAFAGK